MNIEELEINEHAWVLHKHEKSLIMVLRTTHGLEVCGAWECGLDENNVTLITKIPKPADFKSFPLYYGD